MSKYGLIDPEDPTRNWIITINEDGDIVQMEECKEAAEVSSQGVMKEENTTKCVPLEKTQEG